VKSALPAVLVAVVVSACGLFGKKEAPEQSPAPAAKVVQAVPPEALISALPKVVADWTSAAPQSSTASSGNYQLARANVAFEKALDGKVSTLNIEIVDGIHVPSVKSQLALLMHGGGDVHQMDFAVGGHHGVQHWQPEAGKVGAFVVVAGRFLVRLNGSNVPPQVFRQAADSVDVRKLEEWAGVAPNQGG
jgi:hypothetical protein